MIEERLIRMSGITKSFLDVRVLSNVDFSCRSGEVHALVGLNGAGKSTLMNVLGGVLQADGGMVEIDGIPVEFASPADAAKAGISMIHQEYSLIDELPVWGNIFLGRELKKRGTFFLDRRGMAELVQEQLERFELDIDARQQVRDLDSGEKQIVEIIRSLMSDAHLIVMDEPTSALAEGDKQRFFTFIRRMKSEGYSIIYISHQMSEIFGIADRVTVMRDGEIVLSEETARIAEDEVIHAMTGRELENFVKPHKEGLNDPLLVISKLTKADVYRNVSLDVNRGEIVALTGLRGCGAAELAKAVFGLDGEYDGQIRYRGKLLKPGRGPATALADGMGLVTENRDKNGILSLLSVRDNIALPFLERNSKGMLVDAGSVASMVANAIRQTSAKVTSPDQEIRFLSGGNKQKICFSRWLDGDIELLILLEPTRGIDVHAKADIYRIIEGMAERGMGILILSYEIDEVALLADRIVTLRQGDKIGEYKFPNFDKTRILADVAGTAEGRL